MELKEVIHSATAQICQDISSADRELRDPPHRRWARLLVIAAVGALLVAAIVVMAVRIPEFQTEKKTFSSTHRTHDVQNLLADAVKENQTITCPCRTEVLSWCSITTFHIYIAAAASTHEHNSTSPFSEALTITKDQFDESYSKLCGSDRENLGTAICESVLSPVMNSDDSRTSLPTASAFRSPDLLYTEMKTRIETNAYEMATTYNYLNDINKTAYFNYSQGLTILVRKMASQFALNFSSSPEDFWNASESTREFYSVVRTIGFGMDANWTTYLEQCCPGFCDVEYKVSVLNRMLRAMGQVGGITTVISLAVKFLVWPALRMVLHFPTHKALST